MGERACRSTGRLVATRDDGFSILEPVIAMLLLMIVAVSVLPVLTQSMIQSANDGVIVTANSLASQAIEDARSQTSCAGLTATDQSTSARPGVVLRTVRTVASCPTAFPATVGVTVTVTNTSTGTVAASATTLVFVTGS